MSDQEQFLSDLLPGVGDEVRMQADALVIRDMDKREIEARIHTWGDVADTPQGLETIDRGAFAGINPASVVLQAPEHGGPVGRGVSLEERDDGAYMVLRASKTVAGDETLELARDGVTPHTSVVFDPRETKAVLRNIDGKRVVAITKAALRAVSTTWKPYYRQTAILAVRSEPEIVPQEETMGGEAVTPGAVPAPASEDQIAAVLARLDQMEQRSETRIQAMGQEFEERARSMFTIPTPSNNPAKHPDDFHSGDWMKLVLALMSGDRSISQKELEQRTAADLITSDNLGVMPPIFTGDVRETIDSGRPFLESTRKLTIPRAGKQLSVPVITTRPTVAVQEGEKDELASTATQIDDASFNPVSIGGYGDISLQLLKRSDPSYLELYLDLLAEQYAIKSDDEAVGALLGSVGVNSGGTIDPEDLTLGTAWANAAAVSRRLIVDRMWMSTAAVAAFMDAKADGTNQPLYGSLTANFSVPGGVVGGTIQGLVPVHVPALDDENVDVVVGPSRGFGWAEDGTFELQVDVPSKAGRDVGLIGILWFAPLYPSTFTTFSLGG